MIFVIFLKRKGNRCGFLFRIGSSARRGTLVFQNVVNGPLGLCSCLNEEFPVGLEPFQPTLYVGGTVVECCLFNAGEAAQVRCAHFGNQLFLRIIAAAKVVIG